MLTTCEVNVGERLHGRQRKKVFAKRWVSGAGVEALICILSRVQAKMRIATGARLELRNGAEGLPPVGG